MNLIPYRILMSEQGPTDTKETTKDSATTEFKASYASSNLLYTLTWFNCWDSEHSRLTEEGLEALNRSVSNFAWLSGILQELTEDNDYTENLYALLLKTAVEQVMAKTLQKGDEAEAKATQDVEAIMRDKGVRQVIEQGIDAGRGIGKVIAFGIDQKFAVRLLWELQYV